MTLDTCPLLDFDVINLKHTIVYVLRTGYSGIFDCLSPEEQETFGNYLARMMSRGG